MHSPRVSYLSARKSPGGLSPRGLRRLDCHGAVDGACRPDSPGSTRGTKGLMRMAHGEMTGFAGQDNDVIPTGSSTPGENGTLLAEIVELAQREGGAAAARLLGEKWDRYANTDPQQLLEAMKALPGEVFIDNPGLVVAASYLRQLVTDSGPDHFEPDPQLLDAAPDENESLGSQLIILTGATASERTRGNFTAAMRIASDARGRLDAAAPSDLAPIRSNLPHLMLQWGRSQETSGEGGHLAHREYEEAYRLALMTDQPQIGRRAAGQLAWHLAERGRLSSAERWVSRALEIGEENKAYDAVIHLTTALIHVDRNERATAAASLVRLRSYPLGEYWAAGLLVKAAYAHTAAECTLLESEIAAELERRPAAVARGAVNAQYIRAAWWRVGRLKPSPRGEAAPAGAVLDSAAAYRRGDFHTAIERAHSASGPDSSPRPRAAALLLTAASALGLERPGAALADFERAHAIIENERIYSTYELIDTSHLEALAAELGVSVPRPTLLRSEGDTNLLAQLSKRERQVLRLLTTGRSLPTIAGELYISPNTLKTTVRRVYQKLGVNSRQDAADVAHRAGLHLPE